MKLGPHHLAYCTNVHPAETWEATLQALKEHTLKVRDEVCPEKAFAIGLRLSDQASRDLSLPGQLEAFQDWLASENAYVFTINGFPFGDFHNTRVKEQVYRPDWSSPERLAYTNRLFDIISQLAPASSGGSVSSLPASFKAFDCDERKVFKNLESCARHIESLAEKTGKDLHLGLEPEPLGHFENTAETVAFFARLRDSAEDAALIERRIGVNYDTCHFALEYENCSKSLEAFKAAGIRISKIHLSNALSLDPSSVEALSRLEDFNEATYLHQVMVRQENGTIQRFPDIPEALPTADRSAPEWRVHFHIPLYADPAPPLGSTRDHAEEAIAHLLKHPETCPHLEIETYTWGVLPADFQKPVTGMIVDEYRWVLDQFSPR